MNNAGRDGNTYILRASVARYILVRMKILFYSYPWALDIPGGGERQMFAYASHLRQFDIEVGWYDMWNPSFDRYEIFHVFSVMPGVVEMCAYVKRRGLKLVVSPNLWVTRETRESYSKDVWHILGLADRVIVNSKMEADTLSDVYGMARDKFHTVLNGAEADFIQPVESSLFRKRFAIDGPYVLNVANVEPRKRQLEFIRLLYQERPDLKLVVVGAIRDKSYASACLAEGKDNLRIVGPLPYASEMLRSALAGCEYFAMPSLLETPSLAAIEAAVAGVKILLTRGGSTAEYFGEAVTWLEPESPDSIRAGIVAVESATPEHSTWLARDHLLWPQVVRELVRSYKSLV